MHEGLVDQHGCALRANSKLLDHPFRLPHHFALDSKIARCFQFSQLLADQVEVVKQTSDLRPSGRRKWLIEAGAQQRRWHSDSRVSGMTGKLPITASQEQCGTLTALAGSCDRGEADKARSVLLTLADWTSRPIAEAFAVR
jgi:hypothetical protein